MSELNGAIGEVSMTITVTRKDTGKVEEFELVGSTTLTEEELKKEMENVNHS